MEVDGWRVAGKLAATYPLSLLYGWIVERCGTWFIAFGGPEGNPG
jgi:hypothetical protein